MTTFTRKVEAYLSGSWVDISADLLSRDKVRWNWGMRDGTWFDRVSSTGQMNFGLRNDDNAWSPGHTSCTTGWKLGVPVKLTLTFDSVAHVYRYYVDSISIAPGQYGERAVRVTLVDWMNYPARYPMTSTAVQYSKTPAQALTSLVTSLPVAPQATSYDTGLNTFVSVFDTTTARTKALSEISKLMNSEIGYCILKKDKTNGETLTFLEYKARNGLNTLTNIPELSTSINYLLQETGDKLLQENGDKLVLDACSTFNGNNTMTGAQLDYGKEMINFCEAKTTPRKLSTSLIELFSLRQPMEIGSGQTITIKGEYTDPTSGKKINADTTTMVTPTTDDYEAWSSFSGAGIGLKSGSGIEITAQLTITTSYGADSFSHDVTNNSQYNGYITKFSQRGYGIYTWDELVYQEENNVSQTAYGLFEQSLDQDYQNKLNYGTLAVTSVVDEYKEPKTILKKVTFKATSDTLMQSFLNLDINSIVEIKEDQSGVDGYYYIQGVDATLNPGPAATEGFIEWTWTLRQFYTVGKGLALYTLELTTDSENLAVDFGYIPELCNVPRRSISAWIYPTADASSDSSDPSRVIVANYSDAAGFDFVLKNELKLGLNQVGVGSTDPAVFETSTDAITLNAWNHVVMTRDGSNGLAPLFFVNNVNKVTTTVAAQNGANATETGSHLFVGNIKTASWDYTGSFLGKLTNIRIYDNYILTTDDITELYNAGRADFSTLIRPELSFWTPAIYTARQADYIGSGITTDKNLLDAVGWYVGKPSATAPTSGGTYTSQPDETDGIDTYINEEAETTNYGTANVIKIGSSGALIDYGVRGLIKFDLAIGSSPPPASATVVSAKLEITPTVDVSFNDRTLKVYRCKRAWVENQATWNEYSTGNNWQTAGASGANDRESTVLGQVTVGAALTLGTPIEITLDASLVQGWVDGSFANNGMVLQVTTEHLDQYSYASSGNATATYRPKLTIVYV